MSAHKYKFIRQVMDPGAVAERGRFAIVKLADGNIRDVSPLAKEKTKEENNAQQFPSPRGVEDEWECPKKRKRDCSVRAIVAHRKGGTFRFRSVPLCTKQMSRCHLKTDKQGETDRHSQRHAVCLRLAFRCFLYRVKTKSQVAKCWMQSLSFQTLLKQVCDRCGSHVMCIWINTYLAVSSP